MKLKIVWVATVALLCSLSAYTQTDSLLYTKGHRLRTKLEAGYLFGGIITLDNFIYNHGFAASVSEGAAINPHLHVYGGAGIEVTRDVVMVPLFAEAETFFGRHNRGIWDLKIGYAFAHQRQQLTLNYRFKGGFMLSPSLGVTAYSSKTFKLNFYAGYNLRMSTLTYQGYAHEGKIHSTYPYHLFTFKAGVIF